MLPTTIDELFDLYRARGATEYLGEAVTQLEHAAQCAALAAADGASDALVLAAFLHDVGHLLVDNNVGGTDDRHERSGAALIARLLGEEVAAPVRLHVAAKRYLCGAEPGYLARLSPTSIASLHAQGGPFDADEGARFLAAPFAEDALLLRRWDDLGKAHGAAELDLEAMRRLAQRRARG
ncbi:MAG: phosphohydrolase [Planctomycetota bacterium]